MKVALIQMALALGQPEANRARVAELVAEAAKGADLVLLPELWPTGCAFPELAGNLAESDGEPSGALLSRLAQQGNVYLAGSVADERAGRVYNSATVYGPTGRRLAEYSKVHLVPMANEPAYLTPGDHAVVADLDGVKAGLAICYDLRFPELHRTLALGGAQLILIPAEWPTQRLHHWRTLVIARAIENQCFVLACNCVGCDTINRYPGHSMIVDPWGDILAEGGEGEEIVRAEIDLGMVADVRARVPVFRDRRPEAYRLGD